MSKEYLAYQGFNYGEFAIVRSQARLNRDKKNIVISQMKILLVDGTVRRLGNE